MNEHEEKRFSQKARRQVIRLKNARYDDESEWIDIDFLLKLAMEEFMQRRQKNQKTISKYFLKQFTECDGVFSLTEVNDLLQKYLLKTVYQSTEVLVQRTFLYSLMSDENTFKINNKSFLAAIQKYGLDVPTPELNQ